MKLNKIFTFLLLILCLSISVFGTNTFDINQTVPIDATYTYGGVLTHANANLTITQPNGNIDLNCSNKALNELQAGVFSDSYSNSLEGEYSALVIFYSDSWVEIARQTQTFIIGEIEEKVLASSSNLSNFLILGLIVLLLVLSFVSKQSIMGILAGFGLLFFGISIVSYAVMVGILTIGFSLMLLIYFLVVEF